MFSNKKETRIEVSTNIGESAVIDGQLTLTDGVSINGRVNGNVVSKADVVIGERGIISGDIYGNNVMVSGEVLGKIYAANILTLHSNCKVQGDIKSNSLIIDDGAKFMGNCSMNDNPSSEPVTEIPVFKQDEDE